MDFKINMQGTITKGEYHHWYILIEPLDATSQSYIIFISNLPFDNSPDVIKEKIVYDIFADDADAVKNQIEDWNIEWNHYQ